MNVYDFDKTIYDGDSTINFFLFSLKKDIKLVRFFPKQFFGFILHKLKIISKTKFKEIFFCFLKGLKNKEEHLHSFWLIHRTRIKKWYIDKQECTDVVISASPEFLLEPICKELNISHLIASKVYIETGNFLGNNCYGEEKVIRFFEKFPDSQIDNFYSDSVSDLPLAKISKSAFLVQKDKLIKFDIETTSTILKLKKYFLNAQFLKFLIVGILNVSNGVLFASLLSLFVSQANFAFILGYIIALGISYLLNTFFVFCEKNICFNKFINFCVSYLPNFALQNIIVYILSVFFKIPKSIMYTLSSAISFPLTYLLLCLFTFKKKKH